MAIQQNKMDNEELNKLYESVGGPPNPKKIVHKLALEAAWEYIKRGEKVPVHVKAAINGTRNSN